MDPALLPVVRGVSPLRRRDTPDRLVDAGRIGLQVVAGHAICPPALAAANLPILASSAPALQPRWVSQFLEEGVMAINLDHVVPADVAGRDREEPGRHDVAQVRDEQESLAVVDALDRPVQAVGVLETGALKIDPSRGLSLGASPLDRHPSI